MEQIDAIVDWSRIEILLMRTYPVGKSAEGNEAYPPLILMKCLLLQQWFRIDSDPELDSLRLELKNLCRNFLPVLLLEEIEPITQNLKAGMIVDNLMILYLELAEQ